MLGYQSLCTKLIRTSHARYIYGGNVFLKPPLAHVHVARSDDKHTVSLEDIKTPTANIPYSEDSHLRFCALNSVLEAIFLRTNFVVYYNMSQKKVYFLPFMVGAAQTEIVKRLKAAYGVDTGRVVKIFISKTILQCL